MILVLQYPPLFPLILWVLRSTSGAWRRACALGRSTAPSSGRVAPSSAPPAADPAQRHAGSTSPRQGPIDVKGIVSRDDYFFLSLKQHTSTFCICADGFKKFCGLVMEKIKDKVLACFYVSVLCYCVTVFLFNISGGLWTVGFFKRWIEVHNFLWFAASLVWGRGGASEILMRLPVKCFLRSSIKLFILWHCPFKRLYKVNGIWWQLIAFASWKKKIYWNYSFLCFTFLVVSIVLAL